MRHTTREEGMIEGLLRATRVFAASAAGLPEPSAGALRAFLNRPDHLTRAARELARWNEAMDTAAAAQIDPAISVVRVDVSGPERLAFLNSRDEGNAAARAIIDTVNGVRRNR